MEETIYTPDKIRKTLTKKLGKRFNAILAERSGKSGPWVSRHISGTLTTREGRKVIARALGVKVCQAFPE